MDKDKRDRLIKDGWKVGTIAEFLELSPEEEILIEGRQNRLEIILITAH